jgi:hypothetical protein
MQVERIVLSPKTVNYFFYVGGFTTAAVQLVKVLMNVCLIFGLCSVGRLISNANVGWKVEKPVPRGQHGPRAVICWIDDSLQDYDGEPPASWTNNVMLNLF